MLICGFLAKLLGMKGPRRRRTRRTYEKKLFLMGNSISSTNDPNNEHLNSRSLLANVLDLNDDWIGKKKRLQQQQTQQNGGCSLKKRGGGGGASIDENNPSSLSSGDGGGGLGGNGADLSASQYMGKNDMLRKCLSSILKELRMITAKLKEDEDDEGKALDWKFAAMVIDRLCMVVFAVATLLSAILILFTSKNIFKPSDPSQYY